MRNLIPVALVLALLIGAGCSDQLTPTSIDTSNSSDAAVMAKDGPPSSSGPNVVRYQDTFAVRATDEDTNTRAWIGLDILALCSGEFPFDLLDFQEVTKETANEEDLDRMHSLIKGDVHASVWSPIPGSCFDILTGNGLLGAGIVNFVNTDNDYFIYLNDDSKNHNAFGYTANGAIYDGEGARHIVQIQSKCVWDGNNDESIRCNDRIDVR